MTTVKVVRPFRTQGRDHVPGEVLEVREHVAKIYCSAGWAASAEFPTGEPSTAPVTLDPQDCMISSTGGL